MGTIYDSIRSFRFYIVNQSSEIFEYHDFVSGLFKSEIDPFSNITILWNVSWKEGDILLNGITLLNDFFFKIDPFSNIITLWNVSWKERDILLNGTTLLNNSFSK